MATLANIQIADRDSAFDSGAAFMLVKKSDIDEIVTVAAGQEVEVSKNSPYVVARINGATDASEAFNKSHEVVQQGLDLLSIQGKVHLTTRNASDESLIWWRGVCGQVLRFISVIELNFTVGPSNVVFEDKDGNVIPQKSPQKITYNEAFRYFRLSQVTDDLFDAFRNMYLAFEMLLEHKAPKSASENEGKWLNRALVEINKTAPLSEAFKPLTKDVIRDIEKHIYKDIRCAIFHSKTGPRLLPQNLSDRKKIQDGLRKLSRLVLLISKKFLYSRFPTGGFTYAGFDAATKPILQTSSILVSDNDLPLEQSNTLDSPAYKYAVEMKTKLAEDLSEPGLNYILGTINASDLSSLSKIARFGVKGEKGLLMTATIEAELKFTGIDVLEAQIGVQLRNVRGPKRLYKA